MLQKNQMSGWRNGTIPKNQTVIPVAHTHSKQNTVSPQGTYGGSLRKAHPSATTISISLIQISRHTLCYRTVAAFHRTRTCSARRAALQEKVLFSVIFNCDKAIEEKEKTPLFYCSSVLFPPMPSWNIFILLSEAEYQQPWNTQDFLKIKERDEGQISTFWPEVSFAFPVIFFTNACVPVLCKQENMWRYAQIFHLENSYFIKRSLKTKMITQWKLIQRYSLLRGEPDTILTNPGSKSQLCKMQLLPNPQPHHLQSPDPPPTRSVFWNAETQFPGEISSHA